MITESYYNSHRALSLGQTGLLGGAFGTVISSVASSSLAIVAAGTWLIATGPFRAGPSGLGSMVWVVVPMLAGYSGLIQGAIRYPVHYCLDGKLDTPAKKIMGLALEFLASTLVIGLTLTSTCPAPLEAALFCSGLSFPVSILACTILGMTFIGFGKVLPIYRNRPQTVSKVGTHLSDESNIF